MEYIRAGNSGLKLTVLTFGSALTIGTESKEPSYASALIDEAWKNGIRSFDTSNNYGKGNAEILVGQALKKYNRNEYVISTKGSWPIGETPYDRGLSRKHILSSIDDSLKRLNLDYVDIYYAHRYDDEVCMEEIVSTFNNLISCGKIRYWATSEWPLGALVECHNVCEKYGLEKPIIEQFIYSYAVRKAEQNGVMDFCREKETGMLGFSPLCQGYLTGKYRTDAPENSRLVKGEKINYTKTGNFYEQNKSAIDFFLSVCDKYEIKPVSLAIQWCINNSVYPVFGASAPSQITEIVESLNQKIPQQFMDELKNK
jgi:aryl-alcohol dehydrogenase-like predicted oxidoreductase